MVVINTVHRVEQIEVQVTPMGEGVLALGQRDERGEGHTVIVTLDDLRVIILKHS